jgi:hypothetical protein
MLKIPKGCTVKTAKCSYDTWNKGNGNGLEMKPCCIKHLRETIFYLADLFEELGIIYWIDFGTLLGAIREGRTIPHDTDGDMCLFLRDRAKICELSNRIRSDGFYMGGAKENGWTDGHIKIYRSQRNHMAVDLFFWRLNKKSGILHSGGLNAPKSFPIWWVEKLEPVLIFDKPVMGPRQPTKFLRFRFGEDWRKPQNKKVHFNLASFTHRFAFEYAKKKGWKWTNPETAFKKIKI